MPTATLEPDVQTGTDTAGRGTPTLELAHEYAHLSPRQFAEEVMDRLKASCGVDLRPICASQTLSTQQKLLRLRATLLEAVLDTADRGARSREFAPDDPFELSPTVAAVLKEAQEVEPNLALVQADAAYVMGLKGEAIYTYLYTLTKRFENMANAKTPGQLAIEMVAGGLISVGASAAGIAVRSLRAGSTAVQAARAGITGIGMKTAIAVVVIVLATLLLYLFLENPKKILGMVINDTDENLVVKDWRKGVDGGKGGDLFMQHGEMVNFMQDNESGISSPEVQIRARYSFGANDPENVLFAGIYFADRNFGLRGSEGVMVFRSTTGSLRFAHMFAVPYFQDNGTNMRLLTGDVPDLEKLFRELWEKRRTAVEVTEGGYRLRSRVNDSSGGVVGCIASISRQA